ncbi:fungal-specific transcription factor domain-containing protein [Talaromyces proteolyticus]|uniref:Fungal-specific transcription factor domain-containing protein n=1 Tax=Talaromyces proteolyticus TaxID=1131652 RepID=A0AAD4KIG7_9EURO|nr:fungal-specific transcription factor domain-containing protein [Talaromyces proteolyticus]KAH8690125.1 fungal-specific transcription factor domain-containing protein [Talaromyces proteolyticus]
MATRSRKGCIDCKQAKVKCDEVHPSCGTCSRRRRQCRGYIASQSRPSSLRNGNAVARAKSRGCTEKRRASISSNLSEEGRANDCSEVEWMLNGDDWKADNISFSCSYWTPQSPETDIGGSHAILSSADDQSTVTWEDSINSPSPMRGPSLIPLNEILAADKRFIEVYFMRHPAEVVMSNDFVDEMNRAVIPLLQRNPTAVGDSLCAIGENYIRDTMGATLIPNRKTRLLSRLRFANEHENSPELVLMLLLGLSGAEITDFRSDGGGSTLLGLVENVALVLEFYIRSGKELTESAKYFARGVARQDLLISLSRMRRTRINSSIWLDEYSMNHADRFMGFTTSLAPILSELCALAEDVHFLMDRYPSASYMCDGAHDLLTCNTDLTEREASIRAKLVAWRPFRDCSMSMQTSRKFLLHAYAWRAAALLYLFRLFSRPGRSINADQVALSMAYEVMVHISGPPEDMKLSLWPLFIAACELDRPEDRETAIQLFNGICDARPIVTARRTQSFCVDQIWPARDRGEVWDWMYLVRRGSNVFVPL